MKRALIGSLIGILGVIIFCSVLLFLEREVIKQRRDISFMKDRIAYHETYIVTMDKELQIQKDNVETIMKWNEIQAKNIQQIDLRLRKTKNIATGSLELGMKSRKTVGWNYLTSPTGVVVKPYGTSKGQPTRSK